MPTRAKYEPYKTTGEKSTAFRVSLIATTDAWNCFSQENQINTTDVTLRENHKRTIAIGSFLMELRKKRTTNVPIVTIMCNDAALELFRVSIAAPGFRSVVSRCVPHA